MATRIRQLEDALRSSHLQQSSEQHPLLSEEFLKIKAPLQRDTTHTKVTNNKSTGEEDEKSADIVDASGTFSIGTSGETKYYGQIANSWVCADTHAVFCSHRNFVYCSTFLKCVCFVCQSTEFTDRSIERVGGG